VRPPHPQARALATLLIDRGADPFDPQALYNTSIVGDDIAWLEFLWAQSERRRRIEAWRAVPETAIGGVVLLNALDYLLGNAVASNHLHLQRVEWLLAHGANANSLNAYSRRPQREEALIHGHEEVVALLDRHGAMATPLTGKAAFRAACMKIDREMAHALVKQHPEVLSDAEPMLTAARLGRVDIVTLLLELGVNVDVADETEQRGLHNAVVSGSLEVVKLLVGHGADIDRPTTRMGGGSLGFAAHFGQREIATFLAPLSRDVPNLTYLGMAERLRELFAVDPTLVNAVYPKFDATPLFALPDDEEEAVEMAAVLLAHGADAQIRNKDGLTAEQAARKRGLIDAADLMSGSEMV
jgi:ankyrin repeat protein